MGESVLRKGRHSVSRLVGHLVFATKYRKRILAGTQVAREAALQSQLLRCQGRGASIETLRQYIKSQDAPN